MTNKCNQVSTETIEPGAASGVVTTYLYDGYGNKRSASTANYPGATGNAVLAARASSSTHAAQMVTVAGVAVTTPAGTFPMQSSNALNQSETRSFDPRFGAALSLTGPNGLATAWQLDEFGRTVQEMRADGTRTVTAYCFIGAVVADTSSNSAGCPAPAPAEVPARAASFTHVEPRNAANVKNASFVRTYFDGKGRKLRTVSEASDGGSQPRLVAEDSDYNAQGAVIVTTQPYFLDTHASTSTGSNTYPMRASTYDVLGRTTAVYVTDAKGTQGAAAFGAR